eukprot:CAMPEP_0201697538 /NCGR_PEP_ID=MMETSP0578-20130828/11371_1 /ASSEMBLY_ACC=CAM_ASM_000663 /TAXON_ID=267565 /ORGANISM="Skeletonema grethea, Strain CCMP 1804" /LENGTH=68 /DNA_ID=CAMNT_0048183727 /DNA_START=53 /DNA_END=259 /DNA_ORIENTATION=-
MYKIVLALAAVASASAFAPAPRQSVARTVVRAEPDYDAKFEKLQKEAEERLDDKVEELMKNIETVGQN